MVFSKMYDKSLLVFPLPEVLWSPIWLSQKRLQTSANAEAKQGGKGLKWFRHHGLKCPWVKNSSSFLRRPHKGFEMWQDQMEVKRWKLNVVADWAFDLQGRVSGGLWWPRGWSDAGWRDSDSSLGTCEKIFQLCTSLPASKTNQLWVHGRWGLACWATHRERLISHRAVPPDWEDGF